MKLIFCTILTLLTFSAGAIEVRISVKYITSSTGVLPQAPSDPANIDISTTAAFDAEIAWGNQVLANTGRGYTLRVVEYLAIQPSAPPGKSADYWYTLNAREDRILLETAALASQGAWRWNATALNIYVNNSTSGSCSFVGTGVSIALGSTLFRQGTVLHEIGHFMNLKHTHANDETCTDFTPNQPLNSYLADGDGLAETIRDHNCFSIDQLSMANFNAAFDALNAQQQASVNSSWLNVMSYHTESRLLPGQMDIWSDTASGPRRNWVSGKTVFVDRTNTCLSIDDLPANYRWWAERNPPPGLTWGASKAVTMTIDPPSPPAPPGWPPPAPFPPDWPPNFEGPRPPPPYPDDWAWPPYDPPGVAFCFGGPRKSLGDGLANTGTEDVLMIRAGTYNEARRITQRLKIGATRGTVTIR